MMIFTGNIELAEIHGLKNRSIDMHSHLLPSFDDGAGDIKETLNIIYEMKQKGLDALFWTPHLNLNSFSASGLLMMYMKALPISCLPICASRDADSIHGSMIPAMFTTAT